MNYATFLQTKKAVVQSVGIDVSLEDIHPTLFPFQRALVQWALRKGRAALFADCGLGKTFMQLEWASIVGQHTSGDVLILAPLAVASQTAVEGAKLGIEVHPCRSQEDVKAGINIANYEMLQHFDAGHFTGVVLDECFAPDTPIDTPHGPIPIKEIRVGDSIFNASGIDAVSDVHRREVQYAVRITVNGSPVISSPNHPYLTQRGWVGAQDLVPSDRLMETVQAVRMVQRNDDPTIPQLEQPSVLQRVLLSNMAHESAGGTRTSLPGKHAPKETAGMRMVQPPLRSGERANLQAFLRDILLSEMADEPTRTCRESAYTGNSEEAWREEGCVVCVGQSEGTSRKRAGRLTESDGQSSVQVESLPKIERDEPQTFRAWGQWNRTDNPTADIDGCSWKRMGSGVCLVIGQVDSGLSHELQDRHRQSQAQNCYRGGWRIASRSQGSRSEEGCEAGFARVDSLEVLEQGHPELERLRDADGRIYLYDLGATRHPSFSINGLLVHNSSILKSYMGKTKRALVDAFANTPYRLCCTATPAPNDVMEIGNHSELLGIMPSSEMLMRFFINDTMKSGHYRLKGHAQKDFWEWVASWAISLRKPSDIGYSDSGFVLPELEVQHRYVETDITIGTEDGQLFRAPIMSATNLHKEMRLTVADRAQAVADMVNASNETWVVWCNTNYEADELIKRIPDAIEVRGSDSIADKERKLTAFSQGKERVIITKPSIAGFGLNWQHCHHTAFVGLSYSFEDFYQAVRRLYRFGQKHTVEVVIVAAQTESPLVAALERKIHAHMQMSDAMNASASRMALQQGGLHLMRNETFTSEQGRDWQLYRGDCVTVSRTLPENSVHFSCFSPPFSSLYIYSDAVEDMGNSAGDEEFFQHFDFLIPELLRVTKPGRLCAVHCKDLVNYKSRDGAAGLRDFSGEIIRHFTAAGWAYHSKVTIWKDPVIEMQRTKAHGLLYKQLRADSTFSRQGIPEYLLVFRKWPQDESEEEQIVPVTHTVSGGDFPLVEDSSHIGPYPKQWQRYASPVWFDINQTRVLNVEQARESQDEKHICPLQLDVIERAVQLWSNPGETVLSPFCGIGSEGFESIRLGRQFIGIELKDSYYRTARKNLERASLSKSQATLFDEEEKGVAI